MPRVVGAEAALCCKAQPAPVSLFPRAHFQTENPFPAEFCAQRRRNLPAQAAMIPIRHARNVSGCTERFVLRVSEKGLPERPGEKREFPEPMHNGMVVRGNCGALPSQRSTPFIEPRFAGCEGLEFCPETRRVEDITDHKPGLHADPPRKVITVLVLPAAGPVAVAHGHFDLPARGPVMVLSRRSA